MKDEIIRISVILVLLLSMLASASPQEVNGTVTYVIDGDTIHVQINGYDSRIGNITVRLADIDCPEVGTASGPCSRQFAYGKLNGSTVSLDLDDKTGKDRYGRWVAVVYLPQDGSLINFNRMLVDAKHACLCDYQNNEFNPKEWWNGTHPATACRAESSINETFCPTDLSFDNKCSDGPFAGNKATHKYHYPCCPRAQEMNLSNVIWFISSEAARAQGYVPCEVCCPPA
jgi:endonuclease YncB( thermonuclease family)